MDALVSHFLAWHAGEGLRREAGMQQRLHRQLKQATHSRPQGRQQSWRTSKFHNDISFAFEHRLALFEEGTPALRVILARKTGGDRRVERFRIRIFRMT